MKPNLNPASLKPASRNIILALEGQFIEKIREKTIIDSASSLKPNRTI